MTSQSQSAATKPSASARPLTVGQVALLAGVGLETVRFYEREGLLPLPPRTPAGYRLYTNTTVERLRFIQRAKELGFSLRDTQELLALRAGEATSAAEARTRATNKVEEINAKIRDLEVMRAQLSSLLVACAERGTDASCPILVALERAGIEG